MTCARHLCRPAAATRVAAASACPPQGRRFVPAGAVAGRRPNRAPGPTPLALRLAPSGNGTGVLPLAGRLIGPDRTPCPHEIRP